MNAIIYTLHDCPFCAAAKKYFTDHGIPFQEKDVEADKGNLEEMLQKSKDFEGVPFAEVTTDAGVITLRGFTQAEWDEKLGGKTPVTSQPPVASSTVSPAEAAPVVTAPTDENIPPVPAVSPATPMIQTPVMPTTPAAETVMPAPLATPAMPEPIDAPIAVAPEAVVAEAPEVPMEETVPVAPAEVAPEPIESPSAPVTPPVAEVPMAVPAQSAAAPSNPGEDAELEEILKGLRTMTDQQAASAASAPAMPDATASLPVAEPMPVAEVAPAPVASTMPVADMPTPTMSQQPSVTVAEGLGVGQQPSAQATMPVAQGSPMGPADLPPIPDFQQKTS